MYVLEKQQIIVNCCVRIISKEVTNILMSHWPHLSRDHVQPMSEEMFDTGSAIFSRRMSGKICKYNFCFYFFRLLQLQHGKMVH